VFAPIGANAPAILTTGAMSRRGTSRQLTEMHQFGRYRR